ncbi:MAG TPA: hypothetical protein VFV43_09150 [Limnobacter sp.]|nr:hypothetical protein [Limnobacter sp.]
MSTVNTKFKKDFAKAIKAAGLRADTVVRGVALKLLAEVDLRSPVDEGRFRGNNNLAVNKIDGAEYPADTSGVATIARAAGALASFKMGDTINITNSLPYARVIEYGEFGKPPGSANGDKTTNGFSNQAPAGVYGVTALSFAQYLNAEVKRLPK